MAGVQVKIESLGFVQRPSRTNWVGKGTAVVEVVWVGQLVRHPWCSSMLASGSLGSSLGDVFFRSMRESVVVVLWRDGRAIWDRDLFASLRVVGKTPETAVRSLIMRISLDE